MKLPGCAVGVLEWAYPGASQIPCLRRVGAEVMLCGLFLVSGPNWGFVPTLQPVNPRDVCPRCLVALATLIGVCPVCGAELVGDERGRAPAHGDCVGVNLALRRTA